MRATNNHPGFRSGTRKTRSESKQSLTEQEDAAHRDKNVFDIACNCVMFALVISERPASANTHLIVCCVLGVKHSSG